MTLSLVIAILSFGSGLIAAWYWYLSTTKKIDPSEGKGVDGTNRFFMMQWIKSVMDASSASADLNRKGALWTAASVLLAALSAVLNAWPSN